MSVEEDKLALEREKFEFERDLENRKLAQETRNRIISSLGIGIPVLVAGIGLIGTLLTTRANNDSEFRLKAAELALSDALGPSTIRQRAQALRDLFPDRLPANFADEITGGQYLLGTADEFRWQMLQQAAAKADCAAQVVGLWRDVLGPGKQRDDGHLEWLASLEVDSCPSPPAAAAQP